MTKLINLLRRLSPLCNIKVFFAFSLLSLPLLPVAQSRDIYLPIVISSENSHPLSETLTPTPTPPPAATHTPTSVTTATPTFTPTPTPTEVTGTPVLPTTGIWLSAQEIASLPTTGAAWEQVQEAADYSVITPTLSDQKSDANVNVLAKALVYARTSQPSYRDDVVAALRVITLDNTEQEGEMLALARELTAYIISADLIDLHGYDPTLDAQFRTKLRYLLSAPLGTVTASKTLQITHEMRPNNWGTHAGAARIAIALYLGDTVELERAATVFHGWLGAYETYHNFVYDELDWQADPAHPVGINPVGASKEGHSIDGALPEEMRRAGGFQWLPTPTAYAWEGLQGAVVQAELLQRAGYPAWEWENRALLRAVQFLDSIGWQATADDRWQPWLINYAYGTSFAVFEQTSPGKNMGWTNWTHARTRTP